VEEEVISKTHVDEKRSGSPSILRKVQKMVISKSLLIKRRSTRKLASKLTFRGLQSSKDTVYRYLRPIFGAYSCKRPVLCKISKNQTANDFQEVTEVNSLKT
jgi:hypothetical protein